MKIRFCRHCPSEGICPACGFPAGEANQLLANWPAGPRSTPATCDCGQPFRAIWLDQGDMLPGYPAGDGFYLVCATQSRRLTDRLFHGPHGAPKAHVSWMLGKGSRA